MFEVTMLPAAEGDALIIRYGSQEAPKQVLIDAGRKSTYEKLLAHMPVGYRDLELFVVSHVDRDHIEGALELLGDASNGFTFGDVWFNAYCHLDWDDPTEAFGALQGEKLTALISKRGLAWNKAFGGGPVRLDAEMPVRCELPGGLAITLLSPDAAKLLALKPRWEEECRRAGLDPTQLAEPETSKTKDPGWEAGFEQFGGSLDDLAATNTKEDGAPPNGSSIAFLAEYDGKCVLFGADAHPSLLCRSLDRLGRPLPLRCDLVKVPHHGSHANVTRALLERLDSARFLISTNGKYFNHPNPVAIARIVVPPRTGQRTLYFNYDQKFTSSWDASDDDKTAYGYCCKFPEAEGAAMTVAL